MEYIEWKHRQLRSKNNRIMEERRRFIQELKEIRGSKTKGYRKEIKENIGPPWYQVLSVHHRIALDTLSRAIYQDMLEGRPVRTMEIIRVLNILPRPNKMAVQHCMYLGRNDPKEFLAQLFCNLYEHPVGSKRYSYDLNMRIILSSIFYLGLDELINSLKEQFKPDRQEFPSPQIVKKKRVRAPVCSSPYLQKMVAPLYKPALPKRKPPLPLPDLSFLNEPYEEEVIAPILKPAPPPPPLPPPKKILPREKCDELAGIISLQRDVLKKVTRQKPVVIKRPPSYRRLRSSKMSLQEPKKKYGLGRFATKRKKKQKSLPPSTGLANVQYMIVGVYTYKASCYYIIGTVCTLPPRGILVNGGHALMPNGEYLLINLGWSCCPPSDPEQCECLEKWDSAVSRHIRNTKCYCGHRFDFGNEGTFPEDELPLFVKPTRRQPMHFNYDTIYQMDPKMLQVHKESRKIWDNESLLQEDDDSEMAEKRRKKKKKKEVKKPEQTKNCLGDKPDLEDYLRCGIRFLGRINVAARLPDVHLAPELRAWMRHRVYGPYTIEEKKAMMKRSLSFWSYFKAFPNIGHGKAQLPSDPSFSASTSWKYKFEINKKFRKVVHKYKIDLYKAQAYTNNLLWATTYDAEYPDEKFREIYFTYLGGSIADVDIYHPYCRYETAERVFRKGNKRYICLAKGAGDIERN